MMKILRPGVPGAAMKCPQIQNQLSDYLDGALPLSRVAVVRAHLQTCPVCRKEADALDRTVKLLGQFENRRLSREFDARLFQRLDGAVRPVERTPSGRFLPFALDQAGRRRANVRWAGIAIAAVGLASWQIVPHSTGPAESSYLAACKRAHASYVLPAASTRLVSSLAPGSDLDLTYEPTD
jgi:anti-sigma factor RsiW